MINIKGVAEKIANEAQHKIIHQVIDEANYIRRLGYSDEAARLINHRVRVHIEPRPPRAGRVTLDDIPDSLTREQYIPLARRTIPTLYRRERLSMLVLGCLGEWREYRLAPSDDELGDCLWYLTLLTDELGAWHYAHTPSEPTGLPIAEWAKKYIYHDTGEERLSSLVAQWLCYAEALAEDVGKVRANNIRKLIARYPDGFVAGGGKR